MHALRIRPFLTGHARTLVPVRLSARSASDVGVPSAKHVKVVSHSTGATDALAGLLAEAARPGDVFLLHGDVGAGKSHFSRAFIRAACEDDELPVPSPTYLLQNTYENRFGNVYHHFDLYRLPDVSSAFSRLDFEQAFRTGVCLVEWAERLGDRAPPDAIDISISQVEGDDNARQFDISFPLSQSASTWNTTVDLLLKHGPAGGLEAVTC